ncbi:MAG: hypothetical protein U0235_12070 [Polyangiaceae bacterium]
MIFFRAPTFEHARLILTRLARFAFTTDNAVTTRRPRCSSSPPLQLRAASSWRSGAALRRALVGQGVVLAAMAYGVHFAASVQPQPFVCRQF